VGTRCRTGWAPSILEAAAMVSRDTEQAGAGEPGMGGAAGASVGKRTCVWHSQGEHGQGSRTPAMRSMV
jgi:hypothetical protein